MKNDCSKWKEPLLEAALTETTARDLQDHLLACTDCARELAALRVRRERLDALLPLVVRGDGPAPEFQARVRAATQAQHASQSRRSPLRPWPWRVFAAAPLAAVALIIVITLLGRTNFWKTRQRQPDSELAMAEKLARFRAPSDALLATPGRDFLRTPPKLGNSYLNIPVKTDKKK